MRLLSALAALLLTLPVPLGAAEMQLDERPAGDAEWGYRPENGDSLAVTPPGFCWRPQSKIVSWDLECVPAGPDKAAYRAEGIALTVHCPPRTFAPGKYTWRYRGADAKGNKTAWSKARAFTIADGAAAMPMPPRDELLGRVPKSHPRLFVRPEDLPRLRDLAKGPLRDKYESLAAQCERLLKDPPKTAEPPTYPPGTVSHSEEWREIWWGNRTYTIAALDGAATLAFTRLLGGKEEYGRLARRILMDCAKWDPKGATGYRYNDEAGMPYASRFARTYTFVHDLLSQQEREECRRVMKVRLDEMHGHLAPRHLWQPYASHSNRAWHFMGEASVAFHGEIEGADDATWFAMNVFYSVYPVWSDDEGGWHEGSGYWDSYIGRFTWWADIMRSAFRVDAYKKPYFSKAGYYAMYLMPPGTVGGGFGDLVNTRRASQNVPLVSQLAAQAGNPHWQWYVEQMGGPKDEPGYVGFVRGALPKVQARRPDDLPTSRVFWGTGQACLNATLLDAKDNVQVVFKSSPFGTQSHGYEANNSFLLGAYGQRLLIISGYRDIYGSDHHRRWMWSTRSVNNITVEGRGQLAHSASCKGRITFFKATPSIDAVQGEAGECYRDKPDGASALDRFTRTVLFVKPDLVIVFDRLAAKEPSTFEYWLHAVNKIDVPDQRRVQLRAGDVFCGVDFLAPQGLTFAQTDQYDPNPRERVKVREWHLTASTPQKAKDVQFVTVFRPRRAGQPAPPPAELKRAQGGYVLTARLADGHVAALLPADDETELKAEGLSTRGRVAVVRKRADGTAIETVVVED